MLSIILGILLFNSIVGTFIIYKIFGVDNCKIKYKSLFLTYWFTLVSIHFSREIFFGFLVEYEIHEVISTWQ